MALNTSIPYERTTYLPLPPPKDGQTFDSIAERGIKVALSLLQNPDFMMELAPYHQRHEEIPASADQAVSVDTLATKFKVSLGDKEDVQHVNGGPDWHHYEVTDQVPMFLGWKKDVVFQTAIRTTETGMESLSDPGTTLTIHGRFDVSRTENDPSTLTLVERATTNCNFLINLYIKATFGDTHAVIHQLIKAKFVEEMQKQS